MKKTRLSDVLHGLEEEIGKRHLGAFLCLLLLTVSLLNFMGRPWWCQAGDLAPWSSDIMTQHNSQHFLDPYTLTHILHGIAFYALAWLLLRRWLDRAGRGLVALAVESAWEVLENTPPVIEKYREETMALGYYGDSILNSLGDIFACAGGYLLAWFLPVWSSALLFVGLEGILLWWIRDGLLLNILMLVWPIEAVRDWQRELWQ